jgi:cell wall-associated NlpC family hydrolase
VSTSEKELHELKEFTTQEYGRYTFKADHVIRSHRRVSAFPIHRAMACAVLLTITASTLNVSTVDNSPTVKSPVVAVPSTVDTPKYTVDSGDPEPPVESRTSDSATRKLRHKVSPKSTPKPPRATIKAASAVSSSKVETAVRYALAQQGDRYRWGAVGPNAFDCSGLIVASFARIGVKLPHYTGALLSRGKKISRSAMKRGDLVFPTSGHVGIYLGGNKMVVASSGKGKVIVQTVYSFYTARRLL